jgi:hypothetical protein
MSGKGWWNSAISGLESKLDTILADDGQTTAKAKGGDAAAKPDTDTGAVDKMLAVEPASRSNSRSRPSSRLQDRLAKAVNKGADSRTSSDFGSRPESPALQATGVHAAGDDGTELAASRKDDGAAETAETQPVVTPQHSANPPPPLQSPPTTTSPPVTPMVSEQPTSAPIPAMSIPSIVTPQASSPRQSLDSDLSRLSIDAATLVEPDEPTTRDPDILLSELSALHEAHEETVRSHRDELNAHLERIDALQSKLTYLSQQLASSAKAAASEPDTAPADKKLAERDAQIAALMEEGQKLSKTEMKHMTTVKQLRAKVQEHSKETTTLKQRLAKAERTITEQVERAKRAEAVEKAAQDKLKIVGRIEKDIEHIRAEREEAGLTIAELRRQLNDALSRAEDAEKRIKTGALEAEKRATASLKDDIENMRIERKLAEDRARRELQASREEAKNQQEKAKVAELELRGDIAVCTLPMCTPLPANIISESRV